MKAVMLNFSHQSQRRQRRRDGTVLVICLLMLVFVGREALSIKQELLSQQSKSEQQKEAQHILSPVDPLKQKLAYEMADSLNLPWYELLEALETVKKPHQAVFLKQVIPDTRKHQVVINGEVKELDSLLAYLDSLNQHPLFSNALLMSQQQIVPVNSGMAFSLKMEWHHE